MIVRNHISFNGNSFRRQAFLLTALVPMVLSACQKEHAKPLPAAVLPPGTGFVLVQPPPPAPPPSSKPGPPYIGVLSGIADSGGSLVVIGYQGTILRNAGGSKTWDRMPVPVDSDFYGIGKSPSGILWVAGDKGVLLRSSDHGKTWSSIVTGVAPLFLNAVSFPSDKVGFAVGERGIMLKTIDGGEHWSKLHSPTEQNLYAVVFTDERHGFFAGWHKTLLKTSDGGKKFAPLEIPMQKVTRQKPSFNSLWTDGGRILLAGDHGLLFSSTDGGRSFVQIPTGSLSDLYGVCRTGAGTIAAAGEQGALILLESNGKAGWNSHQPLGRFHRSDLLGLACGERHVRVAGTKNSVLLPLSTMK